MNNKKRSVFRDTGTMKKRSKYALTVAGVLAAIWAICLTTMMIYGLVTKNLVDKQKDEEPDGNVLEDKTYTVEDYTYNTQLNETTKNAINSSSDKYLELINKEHPVGEDYSVAGLKTLDTKYTAGGKSIQLEMNAAIAAEALMAEMRAAGFDEVVITSAYRSYSYQKSLFDKYVADERVKNPNLSDEQIKDIVRGYSAEPGYSEHHSGLVVDFYLPERMIDLVNYGSETSGSKADIGFAESEEYEWLLENAHKFGFILRYPKDKVSETGYNYESWHFRFVGVDAATKIHERGITLEAYVK